MGTTSCCYNVNNDGVDIYFPCAGGTGTGVFNEGTRTALIWRKSFGVIGSDKDQSLKSAMNIR